MFINARIFTLVSLLLLLTACTTTQQLPDNLDSQSHQQALGFYDTWQVQGRFAFSSQEEKFSASMSWKHQPRDYQFKLFSMLGSELVSMQGDEDKVTLVLDDQTFVDNNAAFLLWRVTGWNIPVVRLPYWIKGMALPGDEADYDDRGLVRSLAPKCQTCTPWKIDYTQYKPYGNIWLPHRITLTNTDDTSNRIRIRIDRWSSA